ncbi:MAG: hypothetical protein NKF70_00955 [Methanobacterium sp. ERen5]|nr:MAG: hypothetical protein NKF70_00955 [Methanobacterium sp. ERen5]
MFNNNLFIFFVIVLVISITPVSAELIGGSFSDGVNPDLAGNETGNVTAVDDYNTTLNIVEQDLDELKSHMDPLNEDLDYIEKRRGDFGWKFWEWPGIIYDIIETLYKIPSKAEGIEEPASKLQVDINKLNNTLLQAKSLGSDSCDGNASYMATELSQRLNTTVTASAVSASDLQEGMLFSI